MHYTPLQILSSFYSTLFIIINPSKFFWSLSENFKTCEFNNFENNYYLTLYSIITPLKYHVFENIMENGAFALLEQMLHFFIIFSKVLKT